jgi:hypothetical protein
MAMESEIAEKPTTSELGEHRWAVLSERGCEATRLAHEDAVKLVRALKEEDVRGVCVITETAASRLPTAKVTATEPQPGNNSKRPGRPKKN